MSAYPKPCPYISFEDDPYTMGLRLCDNDGMCADEYAAALNRLRRLGGFKPYEGEPFRCTGHAHLAGEHIECLSPAHELVQQAAEITAAAVDSVGPGSTGTFAARMIQPEDDPRFQGGTALGRDAGWY